MLLKFINIWYVKWIILIYIANFGVLYKLSFIIITMDVLKKFDIYSLNAFIMHRIKIRKNISVEITKRKY